ncbi:cactin [Nannizzia gypsea CBS 118893]|uniref:Splicing factor Cactin n=1 Tax=Arthroderma gypseum (strain ATCC MYA-4604 / CBS 118893) TaxID=535722 RepID=E4V0E1_ARTGP|nr:cactin [Nannizzia gypsea CBS 118893]EFR03078.1 cactin [Nannizzia gypsea CBS 118893]
MSSNYRDRYGSKRPRSRSPAPYAPPDKQRHVDNRYSSATRSRDQGSANRGAWNMKEQTRLNQLQEDEKMREWVAQEDTFVLRQAKKKAELRVKDGRAKPIDWLTITLRVIDPTRNPLDDEIADSELDLVEPEGVFEGLSNAQLLSLEKDIDTFLSLETSADNRDYWKTMKVICQDQIRKAESSAPEKRAVTSVAADIDRLLSPKTYDELLTLEKQIRRKLDSNEPVDTDYWEQLLKSLSVWKARAKLKRVYSAVIKNRVDELRKQQQEEAESVRKKLAPLAPCKNVGSSQQELEQVALLDPEPLLQLRSQDKNLEVMDEEELLSHIAQERMKIMKMGFVPLRNRPTEKQVAASMVTSESSTITSSAPRFLPTTNDDFSQATKALYEREVARGISENEEIFAGEETISTSKPAWANKYRPRKPRYFNRVQMGYEWNKYNQTHYDYDDPPPKVVQGYKFNIFYPDLIDKAKAPTYRIEREHGRKRGQSFAPAGEEDTCLLRFIAGPPYEDLAFRIVDKEWDYSAKRERGFRSTFDKGILQLHFQFKKIYYRK